jgi:predicted secreted protein
MTITGALVLFSVIWFMVFFCVLPLRLVTQGDAGEVVPGTPKAAPAGFVVGRKARITTWVTLALWAIVAGVIWSGWIGVRDLDWFGRMSPPSALP